MKRSLFAVGLALCVAIATTWLWILAAPVSAIVRGGSGPPSLVLLHGYGSRAEDWLQFESKWSLPGNTQLHYLQAPLRGPWSGQRGWWWLNLNGHVPQGETFADYSKIHPAGIERASKRVREYLENVKQPIVLGGFSQGAVMSLALGLGASRPAPAGVLALSGFIPRVEGLDIDPAAKRGLPVLIAHGTLDPVIPIDFAWDARSRLEGTGVDLTYYESPIPHTIDSRLIPDMRAWLRTATGDAG